MAECPLGLVAARYRALGERSRTSVSLWFLGMGSPQTTGAIRSSSLTIFRRPFGLRGPAAFGLACAGLRTNVSLWLTASLGAIRSSSLMIWSLGLGSCLGTSGAFGSCFD